MDSRWDELRRPLPFLPLAGWRLPAAVLAIAAAVVAGAVLVGRIPDEPLTDGPTKRIAVVPETPADELAEGRAEPRREELPVVVRAEPDEEPVAALAPLSITVHVLDSAGLPVPGAEVFAAPRGGGLHHVNLGTTDADGELEIDPRRGNGRFAARGDVGQRSMARHVNQLSVRESKRMRLVLETVKVRWVDVLGDETGVTLHSFPVDEVRAWALDRTVGPLTEAGWMPGWRRGTTSHAVTWGDVPRSLFVIGGERTLWRGEFRADTFPSVLDLGDRFVLWGRVVASDGSPVEGARLAVFSEEAESGRKRISHGHTVADGTFEFLGIIASAASLHVNGETRATFSEPAGSSGRLVHLDDIEIPAVPSVPRTTISVRDVQGDVVVHGYTNAAKRVPMSLYVVRPIPEPLVATEVAPGEFELPCPSQSLAAVLVMEKGNPSGASAGQLILPKPRAALEPRLDVTGPLFA